MTILFLTHYDNLYGANNAMLSLIKKLAEEGNNIVVSGPLGSGNLSKNLEELNIPYIACNMTQWQAIYSSPVRFIVKKAKRKPLIKKEVKELYDSVKNMHIDIIHSNSSVICHGAFLSELTGAKHVWHIREFSKEHFNMRYFYPYSKVKELYTKADTLIAISDSVADNYRGKYKDANIIRIYDGVDGGTKRPATIPKDAKDNTLRFIYVGYLFKMKHQLEVIKAFKRLYNEGFTNFELNIVGDGDIKYKKLLNKELDNFTPGIIKLRGYVNNVEELLYKMDVGVIGSEYEGFGLVTVEYMLASKPVIGFKHSGTAEIVSDMETGILYENEDEMVMALKKLMEDKDAREKMGMAGYKRAISKFSVNNNVYAIQKLYGEILT